MPRVSAAFFALASLLLLCGMALGQYMGAKEDFALSPVHAHINLLGWVTMALYGTFYALTRGTMSERLAWLNFGLSAIGAIGMVPSLTLLLLSGNSAVWGPITGVFGGFAMLGVLVFMVSVIRELTRKRATV